MLQVRRTSFKNARAQEQGIKGDMWSRATGVQGSRAGTQGKTALKNGTLSQKHAATYTKDDACMSRRWKHLETLRTLINVKCR